jgi:hypothetical protein
MTADDLSRANEEPLDGDPPRPVEVRRDQVRKEIEEVARNEQSITPSALTEAHELLRCSEVIRRVGLEATLAERRQAAHDALIAALASLSKRDRLIGEAILAHGDYEGNTVDQRKRILDTAHGISERTFTRRRPTVLERIVDFLMRPDDFDPRDGHTTLELHLQAVGAIGLVVTDALALAVTCRAYQFVSDLTNALDDAHYSPPTFHTEPARELLPSLYARHMMLIVSAGYCFDSQPYSYRDLLANNLPRESLADIAAPLAPIFAALPFSDPDDRLEICQAHFAPMPHLVSQRYWRQKRKETWEQAFYDRFPEDDDDWRDATHLDSLYPATATLAGAARGWFGIEGRLRPEPAAAMVASHYRASLDAVVYAREEASDGSDVGASLREHFAHYWRNGVLLASELPGSPLTAGTKCRITGLDDLGYQV